MEASLITNVFKVIGALEVGGFHHADDKLFSGSWDGSVWVWRIPEEGCQGFGRIG